MNTLMAHLVDRTAIPLGQRAAFTAIARQLTEAMTANGCHDTERPVILDTCERYEVYWLSGSLRMAELLGRFASAAPGTRVLQGVTALRHLFRVASGLQSRLTGEPHVLGQVRAALETPRRSQAVHPVLADAFVYAIRCGRLVRRRTALGSRPSGYATQAVDRLCSQLSPLDAAHVAVLGTGALAFEVAHTLRQAGLRTLTIAGRHPGRTSQVAQRVGARPLTLESLWSVPREFHAMVTALSTADPVVTVQRLARCRTTLLVDLGAAPNVAPDVDRLPGTSVVRIEDLRGDPAADAEVRRAELLVAHAVSRYVAERAPVIRGGCSPLRVAS